MGKVFFRPHALDPPAFRCRPRFGDSRSSLAGDCRATASGAPDTGVAAARSDFRCLGRRRSGALMRVNHVGEVCAQALYNAQALATPSPTLRRQFQSAAAEETDHLAWTAER